MKSPAQKWIAFAIGVLVLLVAGFILTPNRSKTPASSEAVGPAKAGGSTSEAKKKFIGTPDF
jgi:hypothetical protein